MNKISIKRPQDELFILTINGGSSSIKFALYQTDKSLKKTLNGSVDRIGLPGTNLTFSESDGKNKHSLILESSAMFVWIAEGFGIRSILHTDYKSICTKLSTFGLKIIE